MTNESKYHPIGCTFRELLLCCDPTEVAIKAALKDLDTHIESCVENKQATADFFLKQAAGYEVAIAEIISYDSTEKRPDGWAIDLVKADEFTDCDWLIVNLYNWNFVKPPKNLCPSEWSDANWPTFSATFADWKEHADREIMITDPALRYCRSLSDLAAEIMWEVTFSGFSGKAVAETGDKILSECEAAKDAYFSDKSKKVTDNIKKS